MILGRVAFGTILTIVVFSAWINLFMFSPDDDEYRMSHALSTVVGILEHVTFIVLAMKFLIERGVF